MQVDRHGKRALGIFLADDPALQHLVQLLGARHVIECSWWFTDTEWRGIFRDDGVAQIHALVTDADSRRTGDQPGNLLGALATETTALAALRRAASGI